MTNSSLTFSAADWRLSDRFAGFTLIDLHGEWLRGEWFTVTVALLGLRLTFTRWLVPTYADLAGLIDQGREHGA